MSENLYLPGSSERKRVVIAYLLVGVLFFSQEKNLSIFEYFHYKQSVGWLTFFIMSLLLRIITFVFFSILGIRFIAWIFSLPLLATIVLWGFLVFQGWHGRYLVESMTDQRRKLFFVDFGAWVLGIFGVVKQVYGDIRLENSSEIDIANIADHLALDNNDEIPTIQSETATATLYENSPKDLPNTLDSISDH